MKADSGVPEIRCHRTRVKTQGRSDESLSHETAREGSRHQRHSVTEDRLLSRRPQKQTTSISLLGKINMVCSSKNLRTIIYGWSVLVLNLFLSLSLSLSLFLSPTKLDLWKECTAQISRVFSFLHFFSFSISMSAVSEQCPPRFPKKKKKLHFWNPTVSRDF